MVDRAIAQATDRVALVAGATGLVGQEILAALLTDKRYAAVHCVGRRSATLKHPKLFSHVVDFTAPATLPAIGAIDDVFIALGTTIKVAGSRAAFRSIDFDAVLAVALAAKAQGATKIGVVSAMGATPSSSVFYSRIKGEMEQAVSQLGYQSLVIARPSMLAGDREALAQAARPTEKIGLIAMQLLRPLIPANYRAIEARKVARILIQTLQATDQGTRIVLSGEMQSAN